jgi:hypothetical protein
MLNTIVGAGAVGARAASRYGSGSGSDQKMRLLAAPAPQHLLSYSQLRQNYFLTECIDVFLQLGIDGNHDLS